MKEDKLEKILFDIYRELYLKSEPSANFDELIENAEILEDGKKLIDYNSYFIDQELASEIIEKHTKKLKGIYKLKVVNTVYMGCSPVFKRNEKEL